MSIQASAPAATAAFKTLQVMFLVLRAVVDMLADVQNAAVQGEYSAPSLKSLQPLEATLYRTASGLMDGLRKRTPGARWPAPGPAAPAPTIDFLRALLPCVARASDQKFRAHGYTLLANCLAYATPAADDPRPGAHTQQRDREQREAVQAWQRTVLDLGAELLRKVKADALEAPEPWVRVAAWSALDALMRSDGPEGGVAHAIYTATDTVQRAVQAVGDADAALCAALEPHCLHVNALNVFEGLASFLLAVSQVCGGDRGEEGLPGPRDTPSHPPTKASGQAIETISS